MAQRRMFNKSITNSSKFLKMPMSSRLLYYDLGMNADDDGFVEHFMVLRMTGASQQDLGVLELNGLVKVFDDNVLWIKDWKDNNYIQKDRYQPSKYLAIYNLDTLCIQNVDTGKDSIELDKNSIEYKENKKRNQNNISDFIFLFNNLIINNINNKDSIYKLLEEYLDIRIKNKYVVNETVVKRLINKLNEYGLNDGEKIMVIENAINGKWKDFYPLKEHNPEWFDKELKNEPLTEEEKKEQEDLLQELINSINEIGG